MRSRTRHRRILPVAALVAGVVFIALPVGAAVTGGCTGEATVDGVAYGPDNDTPSNAIVVPDRDDVTASYSGEVPFANTNFTGDAGIKVGPVVVKVVDWQGANSEDVRGSEGEYSLSEFKAALPVDVGVTGIYEVIVNHSADGGTCRANVFVKFEGNPLSTPLGMVAVAGLVLSAIGLLGGMFAKVR